MAQSQSSSTAKTADTAKPDVTASALTAGAGTKHADKMVKVDIHNETRANRVIYDGAQHRSQRSHHIRSGETKQNVELHESIVKELKDRYRDSKKGEQRIRVLAAGSATPAAKSEPATDKSSDPDADDGE